MYIYRVLGVGHPEYIKSSRAPCIYTEFRTPCIYTEFRSPCIYIYRVLRVGHHVFIYKESLDTQF